MVSKGRLVTTAVSVGVAAAVGLLVTHSAGARPVAERQGIAPAILDTPCSQEMKIPVVSVMRSSAAAPGWTEVVQTSGSGLENLRFAEYNTPTGSAGTSHPLLPASSLPALHSCDMQLADSPGALRILAAGKAYAQALGLQTAAWLNDKPTWFMLTDDPTVGGGRRLLILVHENVGMTEAQINASGGRAAPGVDQTILVEAVDEHSGSILGGGRLPGFPHI